MKDSKKIVRRRHSAELKAQVLSEVSAARNFGGAWLAARRLNQGKFVWPKDASGTLALTRAQLDALVLGLPWQRIGEAGVITIL